MWTLSEIRTATATANLLEGLLIKLLNQGYDYEITIEFEFPAFCVFARVFFNTLPPTRCIYLYHFVMRTFDRYRSLDAK